MFILVFFFIWATRVDKQAKRLVNGQREQTGGRLVNHNVDPGLLSVVNVVVVGSVELIMKLKRSAELGFCNLF